MKLKLTPQATWTYTCGQVIPKNDVKLSGTLDNHNGLHIHCPTYGKVIAQFINPKETQ